MPHTPSDFILSNSSPVFEAKLAEILMAMDKDFTSYSNLEAFKNMNGVFSFTSATPTVAFPDAKTVFINPTQGLNILTPNDELKGISSPAAGVAHEIVHIIDPNAKTDYGQPSPDPLYPNLAEYKAAVAEKAYQVTNNEPVREKYQTTNDKPSLPSPTEHTTPEDASGKSHWEQIDPATGQASQGPEWDGEMVSSGPEWDPGCVEISSFLPDGGLAGDIIVGNTMELADEKNLVPGKGVVSYSTQKSAPGYRIVTTSGASLVCSDTAPIPTPTGLVKAPALLGLKVAVRTDGAESSTVWEEVVSVSYVGEIKVQHITVGDKCFWAGEKRGKFILHHNMKIGGGGGEYDDPWLVEPGNSNSAKVVLVGNHPDPAAAIT